MDRVRSGTGRRPLSGKLHGPDEVDQKLELGKHLVGFRLLGLPALSMAYRFGIGWGVSAVTFGLGIAAVGMSLGFAVIAGLGAFVGTVIPLLYLHSHSFSPWRIAVTSVSLILMLAGVAVCSFSGKWKEEKPEPGTTLPYKR